MMSAIAPSYDDNVEAAIAANDIDALIRFAYGSPCLCTTVKGEPKCVCQMQAQAARARIVPLALFKNRIERVTTP